MISDVLPQAAATPSKPAVRQTCIRVYLTNVLFPRDRLEPCQTLPEVYFASSFLTEKLLDIGAGFVRSCGLVRAPSSAWFAAHPEHFYTMCCPTAKATGIKHILF